MNDLNKADRLLQELQRDPDNGTIANDLLTQFFQGYPLENLRSLLLSHDERILKAGIWIASELGSKCHPLYKEISELLSHSNYYVRFFAIDCVLSALHKDDVKLILKVARLLDDPHSAVRRKTMDFLARVPIEKLSSVLQVSAFSKLEREHKEGINTIVSSAKSLDNVRQLISCENPILRRYGASAAARVYKSQPYVLKLALESDDEDLQQFASSVTKLGGI